MKSICPTHWLTRLASVKSVLDNYNLVLEALQEPAGDFGPTIASRANRIHSCLSTGKCVTGLFVSLPILRVQDLENLNRALRDSQVIFLMLVAIEKTANILRSHHTEQKFK